jgi:LysW-gamma-L-alpha-aminoadipyl-6-phosphate/LysW-L-glutamyl-5-phosphate reductase
MSTPAASGPLGQEGALGPAAGLQGASQQGASQQGAAASTSSVGRPPLKVAIWGASGYAGAELLRLALGHPGMELCHLSSQSHVGQPVARVYPALAGFTALCFEAQDAATAVGCDVLFSCLPHGDTHRALAPLVGKVRLIDLSGDFRLHDATSYAAAYGHPHPHPELLGQFVYGLPELNRERMRTAHALANPGCFATACALSLLPLAREGWLVGDVALSAVTGSSGSGVKPAAGTHHPTRAQDFYAYKPLAHQHEPEITQTLHSAGGEGFTLNLVTHSAPMVRGIHVTAFATLPAGIGDDEVHAAYARHYGDEPFVRMGPEVRISRVRGINHCDLALKVRGRTLVVTAVIDNLVRGASGQAVHGFNISNGLDERTGLAAAPMVV